MKRLWQLIGQLAFWASWPLSYVYLRRSHRVRVIVYFQDTLILLQNWHSDGSWTLPGGGVDHGESLQQAAVREIREETGLQVSATGLQHIGAFQYRAKGFRFDYDAFAIKLLAQEPLHGRWPEILDARWIPLRSLEGMKLDAGLQQVITTWQQQG